MTGIPQTIREVLDQTNWALLAQQKEELVRQILAGELIVKALRDSGASLPGEADRIEGEMLRLSGVLHWIDSIQDAADTEGWPVVLLVESPFDPIESAIDEMRETDRIEAQFNYPEDEE